MMEHSPRIFASEKKATTTTMIFMTVCSCAVVLNLKVSYFYVYQKELFLDMCNTQRCQALIYMNLKEVFMCSMPRF